MVLHIWLSLPSHLIKGLDLVYVENQDLLIVVLCIHHTLIFHLCYSPCSSMAQWLLCEVLPTQGTWHFKHLVNSFLLQIGNNLDFIYYCSSSTPLKQ